jgi:hypothetical protein
MVSALLISGAVGLGLVAAAAIAMMLIPAITLEKKIEVCEEEKQFLENEILGHNDTLGIKPTLQKEELEKKLETKYEEIANKSLGPMATAAKTMKMFSKELGVVGKEEKKVEENKKSLLEQGKSFQSEIGGSSLIDMASSFLNTAREMTKEKTDDLKKKMTTKKTGGDTTTTPSYSRSSTTDTSKTSTGRPAQTTPGTVLVPLGGLILPVTESSTPRTTVFLPEDRLLLVSRTTPTTIRENELPELEPGTLDRILGGSDLGSSPRFLKRNNDKRRDVGHQIESVASA